MAGASQLARLIFVGLLAGWLASGDPALRATTQSSFAAQIAALSEPGGYFDTDNLISNEGSYLHVLPELRRANVRGGAYVGVGPDQNFSYIAAIRPTTAVILDIRRDNLLLHLLFKSLFAMSRTRVEFLALLFGVCIARQASADHAPLEGLVEPGSRAEVHDAGEAAEQTEETEHLRSLGRPPPALAADEGEEHSQPPADEAHDEPENGHPLARRDRIGALVNLGVHDNSFSESTVPSQRSHRARRGLDERRGHLRVVGCRHERQRWGRARHQPDGASERNRLRRVLRR